MVEEHVAWLEVFVQESRAMNGVEASSSISEELQHAQFAEIDALFRRSV